MTMFAGIHDMAFVVTRLGGAGGAGYQQDWATMGLNLGAAGGKTIWYLKGHALKETFDKAKDDAITKGAPTAIVDVTMVCVAAIDLCFGLLPPVDGSAFTSAADQLETVAAQLELAEPDPRDWSGEAADNYTQQLATLQRLVATMEDLDRQVAALVTDHAAAVQHAHRILAGLLLSLVIAQGTAIMLYYLFPLTGPGLSYAFQLGVALSSFWTCFFAYQDVNLSARAAQDQADAISTQFHTVAQEAQLTGDFATIRVTGAEETRVGDFDSGMAGPQASMAGAPAPAAQPGGRSTDTSRSTPTAFNADERTGDTASEAPDSSEDAPDGESPETEPPTGPAAFVALGRAMERATQMSANAAKISADLSQHVALLAGVTDQVETMSSMIGDWSEPAAQQPEPAADQPVAEEQTTVQAAAGADSGERAPADASVTHQAGEQESAPDTPLDAPAN